MQRVNRRVSRLVLRALGCALPLGVLACSAPPPPPLTDHSSVVAVRVAISEAFGLVETDSEQVYFVRMDESGKFSEDQVIPSNYATGGYVFLMNAEPGTYAAVAASKEVSSPLNSGAPTQPGLSVGVQLFLVTDALTYLPDAVVSHTIVRVDPGTTAFMGDFVLDQSSGLEGADEIQRHYFNLLQPGQEGNSAFTQFFSGAVGYRGQLKEESRGAEAVSRFMQRAGSRVDEAGWSRAMSHLVQPSVR